MELPAYVLPAGEYLVWRSKRNQRGERRSQRTPSMTISTTRLHRRTTPTPPTPTRGDACASSSCRTVRGRHRRAQGSQGEPHGRDFAQLVAATRAPVPGRAGLRPRRVRLGGVRGDDAQAPYESPSPTPGASTCASRGWSRTLAPSRRAPTPFASPRRRRRFLTTPQLIAGFIGVLAAAPEFVRKAATASRAGERAAHVGHLDHAVGGQVLVTDFCPPVQRLGRRRRRFAAPVLGRHRRRPAASAAAASRRTTPSRRSRARA